MLEVTLTMAPLNMQIGRSTCAIVVALTLPAAGLCCRTHLPCLCWPMQSPGTCSWERLSLAAWQALDCGRGYQHHAVASLGLHAAHCAGIAYAAGCRTGRLRLQTPAAPVWAAGMLAAHRHLAGTSSAGRVTVGHCVLLQLLPNVSGLPAHRTGQQSHQACLLANAPATTIRLIFQAGTLVIMLISAANCCSPSSLRQVRVLLIHCCWEEHYLLFPFA